MAQRELRPPKMVALPVEAGRKEKLTMSFKFALLGLLADGPRHGYELKATYESQLLPSVKLNYGQVYTTLERLSREGLVNCEMVNQTERPDKKVYAITGDGLDQLHEWLMSPSAQEVDLRDATMLKLLLTNQMKPRKKGRKGISALDVLASERRACMDRLHEYSMTRVESVKRKESAETILVLDYAILRLESFLKWFDRCEEELTRLEK